MSSKMVSAAVSADRMDTDQSAPTASRQPATDLTGRRNALCKPCASKIWRLCREYENHRNVLPESLDSWTLQLLRSLDEKNGAKTDHAFKGASPEMTPQPTEQFDTLSHPSDSKIQQLSRWNECRRCALKELPNLARLQLLRLQFAEPDQQLLELTLPLGSAPGKGE